MQHVVRIDPVIDPAENEDVVHNVKYWYDSIQSIKSEEYNLYVNVSNVGKGWICDEMRNNMAPVECQKGSLFAAWAIGAKNFNFPEFSFILIDIESKQITKICMNI